MSIVGESVVGNTNHFTWSSRLETGPVTNMGMYCFVCETLCFTQNVKALCKGNPESNVSGPRSACGLTALLFCSVVRVLHVLDHGFGVTFDLSCICLLYTKCIQYQLKKNPT